MLKELRENLFEDRQPRALAVFTGFPYAEGRSSQAFHTPKAFNNAALGRKHSEHTLGKNGRSIAKQR
jgi:hypothetical protein